jgi:glycerophosphoryl diester phosphodiesterase
MIRDLIERKRPLVIAHRGARSLAPENTLQAAARAFELGAPMWELDVGVSADDELVVIHDETLDRTSNAREVYPGRSPWRVDSFTLEEMRRLDFGSWFLRDDPFGEVAAGRVSSVEAERTSDARIPTLEEALRFTRDQDRFVNIEIKKIENLRRVPALVQDLLDTVAVADCLRRVLLSSFEPEILREVRRRAPEIPVGFLSRSYRMNSGKILDELGATAYHPRRGTLGRKGIRQLVDEGYAVLVWVVNDPAEAVELAREGVSGFFTDCPQRLLPLFGGDECAS